MQTGNLLKIFLAAAMICSSFSPVVCIYESRILGFLEELRMRMCHPIPNLGLPALDPLELGPKKIALNNKYIIDFTGSIDDFKLEGLSDFVVNTLKINIIPGIQRSTLNITLPLTHLKSLYTAKGSLAYIINLAGDGDAEAAIKDFSLFISWRIKASASIAITGLQIEIHIGDLKVHLENLVEEKRINDFLHALINELGIELLGDIWDYEQGTVIKKVEALINSKISDIIKGITGGGGAEGGESSPIFEGVEPNCKLTSL